MRAPGRTPEAVLNRTTSRRAAIAAGAVLMLVTSATVNPSLPQPAAAGLPAAAVPGGAFTFALPGITVVDREEHAASRSVRPRPHRTAHTVRVTRKTTTRVHRHATRERPRAARVPGGPGRLGTVVAYARDQLGEPYVFGADGPSAWDCSGLTQAAYARIGVALPHRAAGQARRGVAVPRSQARPGDLVVWGSHHVGIYVGRNRVLHAPRPGKTVQVATIWGAPTFRRVTRRG